MTVMINFIGYRYKFKNMSEDEIKEFLNMYFTYFSCIEIKVTTAFNNSVIDLLKNYKNNAISFHLPKLFLEGEDEKVYDSTIDYLMNCFTDSNFVTHFSLKSREERIKKYHICLLENEVCFNLDEYFYSLDRFASDNNIGICLDIGHLMFSANNIGISQEDVIKKITSYKYLINNIHEFHIHDFNDEKDHLQIGQGKLNISLLSELFSLNDSGIIVESNVNDPKIDGLRQIRLLKEGI